MDHHRSPHAQVLKSPEDSHRAEGEEKEKRSCAMNRRVRALFAHIGSDEATDDKDAMKVFQIFHGCSLTSGFNSLFDFTFNKTAEC